MPTKIEWCDETWNPIKMRCTPVSEGCQNCYVGPLLNRNLPGLGDYPKPGEPPRLSEWDLEKPLHWRKPRKIFVESTGDLFHDDVERNMIDRVLEIIAACPQHTFMVLTKRPENIEGHLYGYDAQCPIRELGGGDYLPNLWFGVTVENNANLWRVEKLRQIYATVHFVSVEPMLGPVDLSGYLPYLDWVICGAETGPRAREINAHYVVSLQEQCREAGVPFFFKKWGKARSGLFRYSLPADEDMPREFPITG